MDEINTIQQFVEHVEASIDANKFTIDTILETSIPALFIKAKIDKDQFTQGIYKTLWVKMLEKERNYLSGINFSDLRESRLLRINAKLKDLQNWANQDLVIEIKPLEPLTDEQKQDYYSRAAWSWAEAIYILKGYKPSFQLNTEQVRSYFPDMLQYFTDSLQSGTIGKEIIQTGQKTYIDSPENWRAFWQTIKESNTGPQTEAEADVGVDKSNNKVEKVYASRFNWIKDKGIDTKALNKVDIYNQLNQSGDALWNITFLTFDSEFWQPYAKETGHQKAKGRPKKLIKCRDCN